MGSSGRENRPHIQKIESEVEQRGRGISVAEPSSRLVGSKLFNTNPGLKKHSGCSHAPPISN